MDEGEVVSSAGDAHRERKNKERQTLEVDGTWDIETQGWDTFVCGALYVPGQETQVYWHEKEEAFVDALLSRKRTLWAHNGGRFDTLWLLGHIVKRKLKAKISLAGSGISGLEVDGACFRDSYMLMPMSLAKAALIGDVPKSATELACECGKACGGYCSIRRDMPTNQRKRLREYLVNDCRALYSALDSLCTLAASWDLDLRPTIGASAWRTVARSGVAPARWGQGMHVTRPYLNTRAAYFGGRTQVLRPRSSAGYHHDMNSAYPAALSKLHLPVGEWRELDAQPASQAFSDGKLGSFRADVRVPECFFPPLPVRTRTRTAYPTGKIGGWWTSLELQNAQRVGVTIDRVHRGVVFPTGEMVLAPFCERVWALRDERGPKTSLGVWLKLYANSLTGKLATKPEVERVSIDPARPVVCPGGDSCGGKRAFCGVFGCCDHSCVGRCGKATPIAFGLPFFSVTYPRLSECSHVEWAAYLTAHCRTELHAFADGAEDGVYLDTDSLFSERTRSRNIGSGLGQWKLEDEYKDMHVLAPKTYSYVDEHGKQHAAAKGIPNAVDNFLALSQGELIANDRGVYTFKSAVKNGTLFKRRDLQRRIRSDGVHFGDRALGSDGRTYPRTAKQISEELWEMT